MKQEEGFKTQQIQNKDKVANEQPMTCKPNKKPVGQERKTCQSAIESQNQLLGAKNIGTSMEPVKFFAHVNKFDPRCYLHNQT